jgi:hypothetical protein
VQPALRLHADDLDRLTGVVGAAKDAVPANCAALAFGFPRKNRPAYDHGCFLANI